MRALRKQIPSLLFVVIAFVVAGALYGRLPESVPTHWNVRGVADGYMGKPLGPLMLPLTMIGTYVLFLLIPRISPRGYQVEGFARAFLAIQTAVLGFLLLLTVASLLAAIGVPVSMTRIPLAGVGLLFMALGNVMGKVTKNFFVGIRTPWTLASDEVWLRTHRLGGRLFFAAGLCLLCASLLGAGAVVLLPAIIVVAAVPVLYSYVLYRRMEGKHELTGGAGV